MFEFLHTRSEAFRRRNNDHISIVVSRDAVHWERNRWLLAAMLAFSCATTLVSYTSTASAQTPANLGEYEVKAAFIFHFAQMVEWPSDSLPTDGRPLVFCTIGEDSIASALQPVVFGKQIASHPIELRQLSARDDFRGCHVLFVGGRDERRAFPVLQRLQNTSILSIGECGGFAQQGGVIGLFLQDNKVRFDINVRSAQRARLKVSSRLLMLARAVIDAEKAG